MAGQLATYDQTTLLSLKLRSSTHLRKVSRTEMLSRLQLVRVLDPLVERAFEISERKKFEEQLDDDPHGQGGWHVSFHASQFPGDDPQACPRQALYQMMDLPGGPFSRRSRQLMNTGKQIEIDIVQAFADEGVLLSAKPDDEKQTGFEYPDAWLTGSVDCVIRRRDKPLPIEIKTKDRATLDMMLVGAQGPDIEHVFQIKTQLALVALEQRNGGQWSDLEEVTHGFIYYVARDSNKGERKIVSAEFRVDLDMRFFEAGIAKLKRWKQMFMEGVLPEDNPGKRESKFGHPMGWRWSYKPCSWCNFKKTCQLDFREGVVALEDSAGIPRAKLVRPHYDYEASRKRVKDRWSDKQKEKK